MERLLVLSLALLFTGCASTDRYSQKHDSAPRQTPLEVSLNDAQPQYVEYKEANNRPYTVLGRHYFPIPEGKGYEAEGEASWYGQKFHGHLTANGEIYNMYDMTAAHKTLPLPSFVKVTNTQNNKTAIVRVNDRGPFHNNRIIDLSWAAAKKLDVLKTGTAQVKLEVIHVDEAGVVTIGKVQQTPSKTPEQKGTFIQVAALSDSQKVSELAKGLAQLYQVPTHTPEAGGVFRLRLGPLSSDIDPEKLLQELRSSGFSEAYKLVAAD
ncbi:septal ring lytic transglycosylase RlpA family protein [Planctobacterium marinum]|uniref:septal ring lytic transglycosylase RlpA family protein n=1 Tax=Planctobacterium marinum TaxID=1631968 RepID=UPI001E517AFF|nr:septal ring lytic transglycosylase RlpA family protein [Planctobacterium marinum]MCC2605629.1 septal ring lytic transglycosylase RlpA family protein [Planctobacterium marinum]